MGDAERLVIARVAHAGRTNDRRLRRGRGLDGADGTDSSGHGQGASPGRRLAHQGASPGRRRDWKRIGWIDLVVRRERPDGHDLGRRLVRLFRRAGLDALALGHTAQYLPVQPRRRISLRISIRGVYPLSTTNRDPGGRSAMASVRAAGRSSITVSLFVATPA